MEKDTKQMLIVCGTIISVFLILLTSIYIYSGVSPPFSTVNSGSMQHSDDSSSIGTIDTGDMVIVKDPDSYKITTYVEGSKNGYSKFGEYGDVVIYRTSVNNIIHRVMLEVTLKNIVLDDLNPNVTKSQTWEIPSLIGYEDWGLFTKTGTAMTPMDPSSIWNESTGELSLISDMREVYLGLTNVGYSDASVYVKLWYIGLDHSAGYKGYLTKGDNATTNASFDQVILSQVRNELVTEDMIKSVAVVEIPWLGCIKLLVNGTNTDQIPHNSIYCLIGSFLLIIGVAFALNYVLTHRKSE